METGKLDVAQNSFELFVSLRFQEFAKFVTVGGYSTLTVFMPVLISKSVWEEPERRGAPGAGGCGRGLQHLPRGDAARSPGAGGRCLHEGRRQGAGAVVRGVCRLAADRQGRTLEELQGRQPEGGGAVRYDAAQLHRERQPLGASAAQPRGARPTDRTLAWRRPDSLPAATPGRELGRQQGSLGREDMLSRLVLLALQVVIAWFAGPEIIRYIPGLGGSSCSSMRWCSQCWCGSSGWFSARC